MPNWDPTDCKTGQRKTTESLLLVQCISTGKIPTLSNILFWHCHMHDKKNFAALSKLIFSSHLLWWTCSTKEFCEKECLKFHTVFVLKSLWVIKQTRFEQPPRRKKLGLVCGFECSLHVHIGIPFFVSILFCTQIDPRSAGCAEWSFHAAKLVTLVLISQSMHLWKKTGSLNSAEAAMHTRPVHDGVASFWNSFHCFKTSVHLRSLSFASSLVFFQDLQTIQWFNSTCSHSFSPFSSHFWHHEQLPQGR